MSRQINRTYLITIGRKKIDQMPIHTVRFEAEERNFKDTHT
jgi:hypothetical protein